MSGSSMTASEPRRPWAPSGWAPGAADPPVATAGCAARSRRFATSETIAVSGRSPASVWSGLSSGKVGIPSSPGLASRTNSRPVISGSLRTIEHSSKPSMSGTPTRLTIKSGRLRSSIVNAKEPLVTATTSVKPPRARASCSAANAVRSGSISMIRGMAASRFRSRRRGGRQRLDQPDEARLVDRLGHVVLDAQLSREAHVLGAGPGRQDDDRQVARRRLAVEVADQLVAVEPWHLEVRDDDVDRLFGP